MALPLFLLMLLGSTSPARAELYLVNSFDPGIGQLIDVGFNPVDNSLVLAGGFNRRLDYFSTTGAFQRSSLLPPIDRFGSGAASNETGLDFYNGRLLVLNGDRTPNDEVYTVDPLTGGIDNMNMPLLVLPETAAMGIAYHASRGTFFVTLQSTPSTIREYSITGTLLHSFNALGSLFFGDVAVNPLTGNLFIAGDTSVTHDRILEYTPDGVFVQEFNLGNIVTGGTTGNNRLSGLAFNPQNNHLFVTNAINGSRVTEFAVVDAVPEPAGAVTLLMVLAIAWGFRRSLIGGRRATDLCTVG